MTLSVTESLVRPRGECVYFQKKMNFLSHEHSVLFGISGTCRRHEGLEAKDSQIPHVLQDFGIPSVVRDKATPHPHIHCQLALHNNSHEQSSGGLCCLINTSARGLGTCVGLWRGARKANGSLQAENAQLMKEISIFGIVGHEAIVPKCIG